jgi:hypothetical protein
MYSSERAGVRGQNERYCRLCFHVFVLARVVFWERMERMERRLETRPRARSASNQTTQIMIPYTVYDIRTADIECHLTIGPILDPSAAGAYYSTTNQEIASSKILTSYQVVDRDLLC